MVKELQFLFNERDGLNPDYNDKALFLECYHSYTCILFSISHKNKCLIGQTKRIEKHILRQDTVKHLPQI